MATQELDIEVKRVIRLNGDSAVKAFCDISVAGALLIKGIKVVDGKNGLFVSMPREQGKNKQWYETVVPLSRQAREQLSDVVLEAFQPNGESLS